MDTMRRMSPYVLTALVLVSVLAACGGGAGTVAPSVTTSVDTGGGSNGGGGSGDPGMVLPPFDASSLSGGVLATFAVGTEKFRGWFTRPENTQLLVDAFNGSGAPITSICMRLRTDAGVNGYNAPWTWHVDTLLPTSFNTACPSCASSRNLPSAVEAAVGTPGWLNCRFTSGNAVGMEARASMQVTLLDVVDRR